MVKTRVLWTLAKYLYANILRSILKQAIDDPNVEWDDAIMAICDRVFEYEV